MIKLRIISYLKIVINIKEGLAEGSEKCQRDMKGFENAIDFLMFSYFGISLEDGEDRNRFLMSR